MVAQEEFQKEYIRSIIEHVYVGHYAKVSVVDRVFAIEVSTVGDALRSKGEFEYVAVQKLGYDLGKNRKHSDKARVKF